MDSAEFTDEQKHYLEGFVAGSGIARTLVHLPTFASTLGATAVAKSGSHRPARPEDIHLAAQDHLLAEGKSLSNEEKAKRQEHGLDIWDKVMAHAGEARFPKGTDVFMFKFQGLFYVAPAQDAFMCRLRFAGGLITAAQLRGVADLAGTYGGGYCDITTRANLQIRQIAPENTIPLLIGLADLGIINRGAGADNIRNITASPTAGIDPQELYDTRPLAREMNHYILNHRELYGLPRKFNIAFDGGGTISTLGDTNDLCFAAVRVGTGKSVEPGIYFRMLLGGITGHSDFARDTGVLLTASECCQVAAAAVRVFIEHGDRTDRKKARLKYVLERLGLEKYVEEMEKHLQRKLVRLPLDECEQPAHPRKHAHIGVHCQKQEGMRYVGVVLPAGRMDEAQMRGLASIADRCGDGDLRLTVWQNLIIPNIAASDVAKVEEELRQLQLTSNASSVRAGIVACTGNAGCKFASANTKAHALAIANYLDGRLALDQPINIHLTGCPNSCAQHHIGDIGLLATKVSVGEAMLEGYHLFVGGGYGEDAAIGRQLYSNVLADEMPQLIERMLRGYLEQRQDTEESFTEFVRRHSLEDLKGIFDGTTVEIGAAR